MNEKPSVATTKSAQNPMGQHSTMSATPTGRPHFGNPELNSRPCEVINPTNTMLGHKSVEHGSK